MSVLDFQLALRERVNKMANEHLAMQEHLPNVPPSKVAAYLDALDKHASDLSRLASRLLEEGNRDIEAIHESPAIQNSKSEIENPDPEAA